jgi:hypothetical protein
MVSINNDTASLSLSVWANYLIVVLTVWQCHIELLMNENLNSHQILDDTSIIQQTAKVASS